MTDVAAFLLAGTDDEAEEVVIVAEVAPSEAGEVRVTKPEVVPFADGVTVDAIATVVVDEKLPVNEAVVLIWADEITATEDVDLKAVDVKAVAELSLNVAETVEVCCCVKLVAPSSVCGIPAGHSLDPDSLSPFGAK